FSIEVESLNKTVVPTQALGVIPKARMGKASMLIGFLRVAAHPRLLVAVKEIESVPALVYVCEGLYKADVVPSPKFQVYAKLPLLSNAVESLRFTTDPAQALF